MIATSSPAPRPGHVPPAPRQRAVAVPALVLAVGLALLAAGCASGTAADTTPRGSVPVPATAAAPATAAPATAAPATSAPPTTAGMTVSVPDDATTQVGPYGAPLPDVATATTIPAGTALPGGPVRPPHVETPVSGPCTETVGNVEPLTFQSHVLLINQPQQHYRVYTPACYRWNPATAYPVLYLLHGAQVDESQWDAVGIFAAADRLIAAGAIPPMIIVLPDGIWAMGSYQYEPPLMDRFMLGEVLPAVEQDFRTIRNPRTRAIGGISRGGEWAVILGGRHPELFGAVGGHSPAVGPPSTPTSFVVPLYTRAAPPRLWLDVGSGDGLAPSVQALSQAWSAAGVANELHIAAGGHDDAYWAAHTEDYLRFYAATWSTPTPSPGGQP